MQYMSGHLPRLSGPSLVGLYPLHAIELSCQWPSSQLSSSFRPLPLFPAIPFVLASSFGLRSYPKLFFFFSSQTTVPCLPLCLGLLLWTHGPACQHAFLHVRSAFPMEKMLVPGKTGRGERDRQVGLTESEELAQIQGSGARGSG